MEEVTRRTNKYDKFVALLELSYAVPDGLGLGGLRAWAVEEAAKCLGYPDQNKAETPKGIGEEVRSS